MTHDNDIVTIDFIEQALNRVIQQYKDKPNFIAVIESYAKIAQELEDGILQLYKLSDIDAMTGANLDVIGRLSGQSRVLVNADDLAFFGYEGAAGAGSYGSIFDANLGARYRSITESTTGNVTVADPEYRVLIRARIAKNFTTCTHEELISQLLFLFNMKKAFIFEKTMSIDIAIGRTLSSTELFLLLEYDLLPRASGVRIGDILQFNGENKVFGYAGSGAFGGYGDLNDSSKGGYYASLLGGGIKGGSFDSSFSSAFG